MCVDTVCLFLFQDANRFVFSLALQHQSNWWWFSNLCRPLYLTYLEPWILQKNVACLYFQQFLHCEMLGFILAPLMVAIYLPCQDHRWWTWFSFSFSSYFIFLFSFFSFSIFRTARVRVDWSRCHISHKLMAKSQDWLQDLGELSRRFKNKWHHTTWTPHVDLMDYTWLFRVGCTAASTDHL